jgi:hypothetical protein
MSTTPKSANNTKPNMSTKTNSITIETLWETMDSGDQFGWEFEPGSDRITSRGGRFEIVEAGDDELLLIDEREVLACYEPATDGGLCEIMVQVEDQLEVEREARRAGEQE